MMFFCELVSSEGSESELNMLSDVAEEDANSMMFAPTVQNKEHFRIIT